MGLASICDKGYPLGSCRCRNEHFPLKVGVCPPSGHEHRGLPIDIHGKAVEPDADEVVERQVCPRCEEMVKTARFRGTVCGFCADMLEELERHPLEGIPT